MSERDDPNAVIEQYLHQLRKHLKPLPAEEVEDLLQELRSHILDRTAVDESLSVERVNEVLALLGRAEDVASQYMTENMLAAVDNSRSPWQIIRGIFQWATTSIVGFVVLVVSLFCYMIGIPFLFMALAKLFLPAHIGLWIQTQTEPHTAAFGLQTHIPAGHEVLGWWIVPIGLIVGLGITIVTLQFDLWCIRIYRRKLAKTGFQNLLSK